MKNAGGVYQELAEKYRSIIKRQTQITNLIGNVRLLVFLLGAGWGIYFIAKRKYSLLAYDLVLFLMLFIPLVLRHQYFLNQRKYALAFLQINENSLKRLHGEWSTFSDEGEDFIDENHPYSQDLDIFGKGSLFQFINTAVTYQGRHKLQELLAFPGKSVNDISKRQEIVSELAPKLSWRQNFLAEAMVESAKMHDPKNLILWANDRGKLYRNPWFIFIFRFLPIVTATIGIWTYLSPEPKYYCLIAALGIQFIILGIGFKPRAKTLELAHEYMRDIKVYHQMLRIFEDEKFNSRYLKALQDRQKNGNGHPACEQVKKLVKIVDYISNRHNMLYGVLNVAFLLDYQLMIALERWKAQSGRYLQEWLETIGEAEALSSLAAVCYDHPDWAMPELSEDTPDIAAEEMGHPLLTNSRVCNDLKFGSSENILVITGSNMSGKSTLLRTVGINLVLAYAGSVVCAKTFQCPVLDIYTCMRVKDNLEKNISSFYAELLRIKMIVQAVEEGHMVFFLLDEIFKGTNSIDRHTGARVLINKLSQERVWGLVSTHDLELGDLETENKKIKNYHFQEYYQDNEIHFDYKLCEGISTTRNAAYLMRMAGIELDSI